MAETVHRVRTIMTLEGNMKRELTIVGGKLMQVKSTLTHYDNGVKKVTKSTERFGKKTSGLSKSLNGAMLRFIGLQAAITIGMQSFQKLNEWINESVEQFRKFENSMAEVSTILTGESYKAITQLTEGVKQLSVQYGQSAVDMSRGLYQILSAAVVAEEALNLLNTATKASIAGLTSVEVSVDVLTSIINAYGKSVEQAAGVSDILFQTVVRGKLRFEDLAGSLGYITPIAAAAGVAFEEIAAVLATVTRMGLHVDMASRGLALTIQSIVSPTKQASEAAKEFNVDISAVALRVFGLKGFITDLSVAVKEFGLAVLPRMVRNMRSLRVVMALVSEEGLKGFAEDLDLVYASTGRTDEALGKMIATQQRQAAIVKQSMEVINRSIGEVWSPIKRNIEGTKLWFASFVAGGFSISNANKQIEKLSETLDKNRQKMYESVNAMGQIGQQTIFTQLFNMDDYDAGKINKIVNSVTDVVKVEKYLAAQHRMISEDFGGTDIFNWADRVLRGQLSQAEGRRLSTMDPFDIKHMEDQINMVMDEFPELKPFKFAMDGASAANQIRDVISDVDDVLADNITTVTDNVDAYNKFWSTLDTAREQVFNFKVNILELKNAIADLSTEVLDTFTDLEGTEHAGTLGLEIDVKSMDTAMDRMQKFATMIQNYGTGWQDKFYELFEGKTYTVGGEEISYIDEYDTKLKDAVNTVNSFKDAQEEVKKVMSEVNDAIRRNNLLIAQLQLKGMLRRRGATRAEERAIKRLQIENLKERLKGQQAQVDAMDKIDKSAYEEAKDTIKEYFDSQQFYLFLVKDARDDELAHMVTTFERKEELLKSYQEALVIQERNLAKAHQIELDFLLYISNSLPTIAELYESVYGVSIPASYQKSIDAQIEWERSQGKIVSTATGRIIDPLPSTPEDTRKKYEGRRRKMEEGWGFARGMEYVPKTQIALIHQGERIVPAGKNVGEGGGDTIIENVTIKVQEIADVGSVEKVGAALGATQQADVTRSGKTKYRMR